MTNCNYTVKLYDIDHKMKRMDHTRSEWIRMDQIRKVAAVNLVLLLLLLLLLLSMAMR